MQNEKDKVIRYLLEQLREARKEIEELKKDMQDLERYLSEAIGRSTLVIRKSEQVVKPVFVLEENMSGDLLIRVKGVTR